MGPCLNERLHLRQSWLGIWGAGVNRSSSFLGAEMLEPDLAPRLRRLSVAAVAGREVPLARGFRARLLGLAMLDQGEVGGGLLIPRCSSVHTFGMRFALDLYFLDREEAVVAKRLAVPPKRFAFCRGASAVLELPAGTGGELTAASP